MATAGSLRFCAVAALLLPLWLRAAEVPVPPLKARVTDLTATLDDAQRTALERKLAAFEARKGSQIAVLLVPTTQPETIEQYSMRVVEQWKLGRKGVDDGVLLLAAMQDRAVRIEVGYGLEGALPDALARRIIDEQVLPRFRRGEFHAGIDAAVDGMIRVIDGEALAPAPRTRERGGTFDHEDLFVVAFVLVFVLGSILHAMLGRIGGSGVVGAVAGFSAWMVLGSVAAAVIFGIVIFVLSLAGVTGSGRLRGRRSGSYSGGGWSSGGGFGGGGGGFGGGGASGRW